MSDSGDLIIYRYIYYCKSVTLQCVYSADRQKKITCTRSHDKRNLWDNTGGIDIPLK